jgi:hypothetical protein
MNMPQTCARSIMQCPARQEAPWTRGCPQVELDASEHLVMLRDREAFPSDRLVV